VQERVAELIRTIDTLLMEMHNRGMHWKAFLDQLSVINNTYTAVSAKPEAHSRLLWRWRL
jgi:hypothetical protein